MYKVSLVIPVYNVEKYILECLYSALNQSFASIEYIIVDDCGSDNSMSIVAKILQNHCREKDVFIYKHDKNLGLSAARNTGLDRATGEYVYFMDSDDEITEDCIEKHFATIVGKDADFTVANTRLEGAKSIHVKLISSDVEDKLPLLSYMERRWNISAWNKLYRRSFLQDNNFSFKEGLLHEDILWSYQLSCKAQRIALVEGFTYIYKIHQGSITTNRNGSRKIESLLYILRFIDNDKKNNILDDFLNTYYFMFDFWRLNTAMLLLNYDGSPKDSKRYYLQLKELKHRGYANPYSLVLGLPFTMFKIIGTVAYKIYKRNVRTNR